MHYKKTKFTKQFIFLSFFISAMMATDLNAQSFPQPGDTIQRKLKEVEVQGSLGEAVENIFSSTTISGQTARESSPNGSINPIFDQVPSMITTSDAGTGIGYTYMRIRGVDQTRINVTMNGVAINDAESQGTWLVNLPDFGTHVTELNVQRGVGNSSNGSAAFGASINLKPGLPKQLLFSRSTPVPVHLVHSGIQLPELQDITKIAWQLLFPTLTSTVKGIFKMQPPS